MDRRKAGLSFLTLCVTLAALLLTHLISPLTSGIVFALGLVVYGILSKGFRDSRQSGDQSK